MCINNLLFQNVSHYSGLYLVLFLLENLPERITGLVVHASSSNTFNCNPHFQEHETRKAKVPSHTETLYQSKLGVVHL